MASVCLVVMMVVCSAFMAPKAQARDYGYECHEIQNGHRQCFLAGSKREALVFASFALVVTVVAIIVTKVMERWDDDGEYQATHIKAGGQTLPRQLSTQPGLR